MRDAHTHSAFSADSDCPMEEMIKGAIDKNLDGIYFTEHLDISYPYPEEHMTFPINEYFSTLNELKEKYKDRIKVCSGIEVGMGDELGDSYRRILYENEFDFCLGSLHVSSGRDPYYPDFINGRTPKEAYTTYFLDTLSNIKKFDDFDSLGHLDYFVRYADPENLETVYSDNEDTIKRIFDVLISKDKALEINTAGVRKASRDFNPPVKIFELYRDMGGKMVTFGSDAHKAGDIAYEFEEARNALKNIGFKDYCYYQKRSCTQEKF